MEKKDLKKLLASLGIASLLSMGGITLPGAHAGSGWGAKPSTGSTEQQAKPPASGTSGTTGTAVSTEEQKKMEQMKTEEQSAEEQAKKAAEEEANTVKKKSGKSGWSGN